MAVEQRVVELVIDASGVVAGSRLAASAYDYLGDRGVAAADRAQAAFDRQRQVYERQLPRSIDQVSAAYDRLRGRIDPVFNAQIRAEREMTQSLSVINRAVMLGVTTEQDATATIARLKQQQVESINRVRDAQLSANNVVRAQSAANDNDAALSGAQNRRQNLGYQIQDIGVSLYGGMPVGTVLLQQGSQILGIYGGSGGVNALLKDLGSLIVSVTRYMGPFAAAAIAVYGAYKILSSNTLEARLAVDETTRALASQAASAQSVQSSINDLVSVQATYTKAISETGKAHTNITRSIIDGTERQFAAKKALLELELKRQEALVKTQQSEMAIAQLQLRQEVGRGVNTRMDLEARGFADPQIGRFVNLPDDITGLQATREILDKSPLADKIKEMRANLTLTEEAANSLREALGKTFQTVHSKDPRDFTDDRRSSRDELDALRFYVQQRDAELRSTNSRALADQQMMRARTNAERFAAVEAQVRARASVDGDRDGGLQARIDRALMEELTRQEIQLRDAQDQRGRALQRSLDDQQLELSLLGKSSIEADALRRQYQLIAELKDEAAKTGGIVDQSEIDRIKVATSEIAKMQQVLSQARLTSDLQFEFDQLGRSSVDQRIASNQRSAGLPVDMNSDYAVQVRELERVKELRSDVKGFFSDFKEGLLAGDSIGDALKNSILNALSRSSDRLLDRLFDSVANWIAGGSGSGAGQTVGAAGSIASKIVSGVANDNVAGGFSGLANGSSVPATDVASFIAKIAPKYNVDVATALAVAKSEGGLSSWNRQSDVIKNGVREPSFGPFQLYKGGGLGNQFMKETGLDPALAANGPAATEWAIKHASQNGWGAWYGARNTGIGNWQGIGGNATGAAAEAASSFADATAAATKSVDAFGGGLGKLGQSLTGAFPAAPAAPAQGGSGGLFGWLGSLFGGTTLNSALSASPQFARAWSLGGIGLYDRGGFTGHGGVNDPAGVVHRGEVVWSQADVARAGGVATVEAMRLGYQGYANGGTGGGRAAVATIRSAPERPASPSSFRFEHTHSFDNDGNLKTMTRTIVREEAPGIASQVGNEQRRDDRIAQARGGIGEVQQQFTKRKA